MKPLFFSLLIIICSTAASAQMEVIVLSSITLDKNAESTTSKAYIHEQKVLVESSGERHESTMLFDAEKETFYIIDHNKKEYTEMTRQDLEALSSMVSEQMKMLEQQLANLPEAQREAVRKQMSAAFEQAGQQSIEFKKEAAGKKIKNWETDKYTGMAGDQKKSEIYMASYQTLGHDKKDFEALEKFYSMMQDFARSMSRSTTTAGLGLFGDNMPAYEDGIPVKTIFYDERGEPMSTSTVNSIEEEEVEESLFSIPENYRKRRMAQHLQD